MRAVRIAGPGGREVMEVVEVETPEQAQAKSVCGTRPSG